MTFGGFLASTPVCRSNEADLISDQLLTSTRHRGNRLTARGSTDVVGFPLLVSLKLQSLKAFAIRCLFELCYGGGGGEGREEDPGFRNQVREETSLLLGAQDQQLGAEQDQLPCRSTGTSSGDCQETEACLACHTPRQPLENHPSGHLGEWATPLSAEEMLDGQHHRVDVPAHARTAHEGLLQKSLEENLC